MYYLNEIEHINDTENGLKSNYNKQEMGRKERKQNKERIQKDWMMLTYAGCSCNSIGGLELR